METSHPNIMILCGIFITQKAFHYMMSTSDDVDVPDVSMFAVQL